MILLINLQIALGYFFSSKQESKAFPVKKKKEYIKKEAEIHCKHY